MGAEATLMIHGGAGTIQDRCASACRPYEEALTAVLRLGRTALQQGLPALEVACIAVRALEDCPLFNAGRGAVFTADGRHELDAAVMDGATLRAGAVAGLTRSRNPIDVARALALAEAGGPVMLQGCAGDEFAASQGLEGVDPAYFHTELRWRQWQAWRQNQGLPLLDHSSPTGPDRAPLDERSKMGTVGAVVRDGRGHLAAATSTGGMTGKRAGRVGDSPLIGAGTFADDQVAVSCTGEGEAFIRAQAAHSVAARMRWGGQSAAQAAQAVVHEQVARLGAQGGLIALASSGPPWAVHNTPGMYRGWVSLSGKGQVAIF